MSDRERLSQLAASANIPLASTPEGEIIPKKNTAAVKDEPSRWSVTVPIASRHFDVDGNHVSGFNEHNLGVGARYDISRNASAFVTEFRNSYRDPTLAAGVTYAPLHLEGHNVKADAGVSAGAAYTAHGSYARAAPPLSAGKFTALAGLYAGVEHTPSGVGAELNIVPPLKKGDAGFVGVAVRKRF